MDQLIDAIRAATTSGATPDQKAAGIHACRALIAALDTEPGKPILMPGAPAQSPLVGMSVDSVLDMLIARLTTVANARETTALSPVLTSNGLRVPATVSLPRQRAPTARPAGTAPPVVKAINITKPPATRKP